MEFFRDAHITIRTMTDSDAEPFCREEIAQGWIHATEEKWHVHVAHQNEGKCIALTAETDGQLAGYINVYFKVGAGPYKDAGCCEIVDFGVLEKYRRRGIGSKLMDAAEKLAAERDDKVCIGVGLHSGYGSAQRMYVKRGYLPDGSGVWYEDTPAEPYQSYPNDDSLNLYLLKRFSVQE